MLKKFLVTFAFLILLFSTNVFASNSATPLYDEDLVTTINTNLTQALASRDLDINDYHYIICTNDTSYLKVYCFEKTYTPKFYIDNYGNGRANFYADPAIPILWYKCSESGELTFYRELTESTFVAYNTNSLNFFYSTYNIYSDANYSNFFFHSGVLRRAIQGVEMKVIMKEVVAVLPVLLIILVLCLAFWKGFKNLLFLIRRA